MSRVIKFRGLKTDGSGWAYGDLVNDMSSKYIIPIESSIWTNFISKEDESYHHEIKVIVHKIIPGSESQFTGLHDKNGKEIYEGDIGKVCNNQNGFFEVVFRNAYVGGWVLKCEDYPNVSLGARLPEQIEIIGNIHENNDLL